MNKTKLAVLRVDVTKETGEVMLLVETTCGFRPVMGWPDVSGLKDFANNLLRICSCMDNPDSIQTDIAKTD